VPGFARAGDAPSRARVVAHLSSCADCYELVAEVVRTEEELDEKLPIGTEDAYDMVYKLGTDEGIVVGQSSGANLVGALQVARRLERGVVVTIFCDFGVRYLSTNLWAPQ